MKGDGGIYQLVLFAELRVHPRQEVDECIPLTIDHYSHLPPPSPTYLARQGILAIRRSPSIPLEGRGYNSLGKNTWFIKGFPDYSETFTYCGIIPFSLPNWRIAELKI